MNQMMSMYFVKDKNWIYEDEYRLLFQNHNYLPDGNIDIYGSVLIPLVPTSVRIGYRMDRQTKIKVLNHCFKFDIDVYIVAASFAVQIYEATETRIKKEVFH
ncbi:hypothetical protein CI105_08875 [Candidatus Izimaplasma bacterium ZiA1]|uniref:hypothetical protein n=1 Tax=Candidatus Izimoplasma sp. ZiA1 TaxID=2024899 RepID=UPI000BAA4C6B|nr:hypothetical protein CI105_08875 [Candidatus Izimaplasma bacterium ZiA1]